MTQRDAHTPLDTGPPRAHPSITPETVRGLVDDQDPDFHELELGERFDGWDMAMYRLGDDLAVRLPRVEAAVDSLIAETRFVPRLSDAWDFPFPRVVRSGLPGHGYPWPWAIVSWVPSATADKVPLTAAAGPSMGRAIAQIHCRADADAPYNPEQSLPMAARGADLAWALDQLADARGPAGERLDVQRIDALWKAALDAPAGRDVVWSHADLHGSNVLSANGAFAGIIDWGKMAGCDRAVDLGFLYTVMPHAGVMAAVAAYREATGVEDPGLEDRLTGIGLSKCVLWATLDRPLNLAMAWRGLHELSVIDPREDS
ncbi:phosphotransferase [Demequina activiva]|nr:phosphotransferase [Demequina activiva]